MHGKPYKIYTISIHGVFLIIKLPDLQVMVFPENLPLDIVQPPVATERFEQVTVLIWLLELMLKHRALEPAIVWYAYAMKPVHPPLISYS